MNKLISIFDKSLNFIFTIFLSITALCSFFFTTYFPKTYYEIPYVKFSIGIFELICVCSFIYFFYQLAKKISLETVLKISSIIIIVVAVFWVILIRYIPQADQELLLEIIESLRYGSFYAIQKGGYLSKFPNQLGITLFMEFLFLLPGDTVFLFQIVNITCLPFLLFAIYKITKTLFNNETVSKLVCILAVLFFPILLYTPYFYGNVISITFSCLGIYKLLEFMNHNLFRTFFYSCLFFAIGYCFKTNLLVVICAAISALTFLAIKEKKVKKIIYPILLGGAIFLADSSVRLVYETITQQKIYPGIPSTAFVAMGLQESIDGIPGWFNAFTNITFIENDCNKRVTDNIAKQEISNRISVFRENPNYALQFFAEKYATQWLEPTFQSLWISRVNDSKSIFIKDLYYGNSNFIFITFLDGYQSLVYLGALVCLLLKRVPIEKNVLIIAVFGGFLFHLIWEAKSQYILQYFILLLPLASFGIDHIFSKLERKFNINHTIL